MESSVPYKTVLWGGLGFVLLLLAGVAMEQYYLALIPAFLWVIWAAFFRLDLLYMFVVICTPLSLNLEEMDLGGIGFYLPTEPLMFGILLIFIFKLLSRRSIDRKIFHHPISYLLYAYLGWMLITSISSEMPIVSFKFLLAKMWFLATAYFLATHIFQNIERIRQFYLLYLFPLMGVIIYTAIRHASYAFDKDAGHWVMSPFFKDHTSYGAVLAMFFPVVIGLLVQKKMSVLMKTTLYGVFAILTVGIVLSYTRAAWVSIIGALGIGLFMYMRIQLRHLIAAAVLIGGFVFIFQDDIFMSLERNKQDSSDDLAEHVESISNVSSDASNLERLNRWNCAWLMFKERPIVGWGPGVYQFVYAPFQRSSDITIISTNNADGGNAHSEYLGPLCEQGVLGMLLMIALVLMISAMAFRLYFTLQDQRIKIIVMSSYLGLCTYFIHGILNNYLDTDKASIPFWGFTAILVAVDLFHNEGKSEESTAE